MKELLEAGVHFGHQTKRWNPKMKDYIFGQRNGIYIIDLQKTIKIFKEALVFIQQVVEDGKDILIVGTKKQAQDIIKDFSEKCESCFVNQRWLGGLLTNFQVIRGSVEKLIELEEMKEDGRWDILSKKEQSRMEKVFRKLSKNLGGIKNMLGLPGAIVVIDSTREDIAIKEAQKLNIPIVAIVDTNGDPDGIDYAIPGNDDAVRAIELFATKISDSIIEGKKNRIEKELFEEKDKDEAEEEEKPEGADGEIKIEDMLPPLEEKAEETQELEKKPELEEREEETKPEAKKPEVKSDTKEPADESKTKKKAVKTEVKKEDAKPEVKKTTAKSDAKEPEAKTKVKDKTEKKKE